MRTRIRRNHGFTLVELMIVMVIIAVLAAIALARWHDQKVEAIVASLKSDLRNIAAAQEAYFTDNQTYTSDVDDLQIRLSQNVEVTLQAQDDGWTGRATHPASDGRECALYYGKIAPLSPARNEGIVWCE